MSTICWRLTDFLQISFELNPHGCSYGSDRTGLLIWTRIDSYRKERLFVWVPVQANMRGYGSRHLLEHLCCVCMIISVTFVCDCLCPSSVRYACVCGVCVCIPHKALGLQAAWWRCRWDNIWHVSDWASVRMRVCVCDCLRLCISVHLGSPLIGRGSLCSPWPTGEPARWGRAESSFSLLHLHGILCLTTTFVFICFSSPDANERRAILSVGKIFHKPPDGG